MKILISNDDGVYAQGLAELYKALGTIAEKIAVVAPDRNRSGASNSLTLDAPIRALHLENGFFSVQGTPTDCVHLAITGLIDFTPDIVVTGINAGANLGDDIWYSGTVAAATEGRFLGLPAVAVSLTESHTNPPYYATAGVVARQIVERLVNNPLPASTILNVNVPNLPLSELQGFEVTRLGTRHRAEAIIKDTDPRGHEIYWIGAAGSEQDAGPGTDFYAINARKVSMTPLKIDLTNYEAFDRLSKWVLGVGY